MYIILLGNLKISEITEYIAPLDERKAVHLIKRLNYQPSWEQIANIVSNQLTAKQVVTQMLGNEEDMLPTIPLNIKFWMDTIEQDTRKIDSVGIRAEVELIYQTRYEELVDWSLDLIKQSQNSAREKLVQFWSSLWNVEFRYISESILPPALLLRSIQSLRKYRVSNYKKLCKEMILDGSIILYRNIFFNNRKLPNESASRKLFERYTMGEKKFNSQNANYSENDIKEAAKVLTGWRVFAFKDQVVSPDIKPFDLFFEPQSHILSAKRILGKLIPATSPINNNNEYVRNNEINKLCDILFSERTDETAFSICCNIYCCFVDSKPEPSDIEFIRNLATEFAESDFDLKYLYQLLFSSEHFYQESKIGCKIKSPIELIVGFEQFLKINYKDAYPGAVRKIISELGQSPFVTDDFVNSNDDSIWATSMNFAERIKYLNEMLSFTNFNVLITILRSIPDYTDPNKLLEKILILLLPKKVSDARFNYYKELLLNNINEKDWAEQIELMNTQVGHGFRKLLLEVIVTPDFQLC